MSANKAYLAIVLRKLGGVEPPPPAFNEITLYYFEYGNAYYYSEGSPYTIP